MRTTLENILLTHAFDSPWNDDHGGDVDSPTGYFARFVIESDLEAAGIIRDFNDEYVNEDGVTASDLVGAWFVWQTSTGAVNYHHAEQADDQGIADTWTDYVAEYDQWLNADENEV